MRKPYTEQQFECGSSGWEVCRSSGLGGNLNRLVGEIDETTAKNHESSFKIALTPDNLLYTTLTISKLYRIPIKRRCWQIRDGSQYNQIVYILYPHI